MEPPNIGILMILLEDKKIIDSIYKNKRTDDELIEIVRWYILRVEMIPILDYKVFMHINKLF